MDLIMGFPCVVAFGIPFPFDEVLECPRPSMTSVADNSLHLIFLFPFDKVRWGTGEVGAMGGRFVIGR